MTGSLAMDWGYLCDGEMCAAKRDAHALRRPTHRWWLEASPRSKTRSPQWQCLLDAQAVVKGDVSVASGHWVASGTVS